MPSYELLQVDAFTDRPLGGNPCAIVFDADGIEVDTMQAVAREMNLSETSFVLRSEVADFRVRYFTPAEEVPLAGHPTIATARALVDTGRLNLQDGTTSVTLELQVGPIGVDLESQGGELRRVVMTQQKPAFLRIYDPSEVLPVFGLTPDDALSGVPVQTVSTGTPQLMVPLAGHDALRRARPDHEAYLKLRGQGDFFSAHLFCLGGFTEAGDTSARHFGTPPDLFEDPFTGSATGGMAAYLWRYGLIDEPSFTPEQGHWMGRPGVGTAEVVGPRDDVETVRVGGSAVTVVRGRLEL